MTPAHALPAAEVAAGAGVDPSVGLAGAEARRRLGERGPNELAPQPRPSVWTSLAATLREPFVILLALAGLGAVALGETRDGLLMLAGLVPIVGADVVTSYRSERALDALRDAAAPRAHVRRDGAVVEIPAAQVVPGDVLVLRAGDVVAADARVLSTTGLAFDRSTLTGESLPEPASVVPDAPDAGPADRHAIAYAGTSVVEGRGTAVVVATGPATELGRIAAALGPTDRDRSPLQRELDRLVRILLVAAISLVVFTVSAGLLRGLPAGAALLAGISAAIAAIPEEPPVLVAVVLGLGAYRLLRRGVLVRRLSAQETLGAIDLIITDKTGTLTENRLSVAGIETPDGALDRDAWGPILRDAILAEDDAWTEDIAARHGSFTRALAAAHGGMPPRGDALLVDARGPSATMPVSRVRYRPSPASEERGLAIGAAEPILRDAALPDVTRAAWHRLVEAAADAGRRTVLLAESSGSSGWRPIALIAFADALRADVPPAMALATEAGIQTIVVTGDHLVTARAIARDAGLAAGWSTTGAALGGMADDAVRARLGELRIVARAVPEEKLRLVKLARLAGRTVAVTGDGVNDAPALHGADVAVAMGSGTAVAREASDLVLGDDSFGTLLGAIRDGRRIVANVQKGLVFIVSTHVALLGFILVATIAGFDQPLLPLQILWLELFIDLSASIAFEREPEEPGAMQRPPRARGAPLLPASLLVAIALAGGTSAVAALAILLWMPGEPEHVRWVAYSTLVVAQAVRALANRALTVPVRRLRLNAVLVAAAAFAVAFQLAIPAIPFLADAFRASPLTALDLAVVGAVALGPALVAEIARTVRVGRPWVA